VFLTQGARASRHKFKILTASAVRRNTAALLPKYDGLQSNGGAHISVTHSVELGVCEEKQKGINFLCNGNETLIRRIKYFSAYINAL
jgi:hypothetical protein